ncbi:MAG: oxidoreductase [Acidobacteria bacterium]|nr:oxidoreductase [Acidobacteriota bacterium]
MTTRILPVIALCVAAAQNVPLPRWTPQTSGVTARLRGVSAVTDRVAWASGSNGTVIRTTDGGSTWQKLSIPGSEQLDFRDIDAIDERVAYVLSIGPGDASRIYKTVDGGSTWQAQFTNLEPKAFFDAMAFWDARSGIAVSDSVDGVFVVIVTRDGGQTWTRVPTSALPPALPNEGAFAASGTNVAVYGTSHVWIGTGAAASSRVLRSTDGAQTWAAAITPLPAGPSAGIFSIAFRDASHGIVVGGDYRKEAEIDNAAVTTDGGVTWTLRTGLSGFRSVVAYLPDAQRPAVLAVGPSGADYRQRRRGLEAVDRCRLSHRQCRARRARRLGRG